MIEHCLLDLFLIKRSSCYKYSPKLQRLWIMCVGKRIDEYGESINMFLWQDGYIAEEICLDDMIHISRVPE